MNGRARTISMFLWLALAVAGPGCASELAPIQRTFRAGEVQEALGEIRVYARRHDGDSPQAVIAALEHGSIARMAGAFADSDAALARAEARMFELDERPGIGAGERLSAMVRTPDRIAYEGFFYDRQFAAAYRALNALALGDLEVARQHLVRADRWQAFAIAENRERAARVGEAQAAARQGRGDFDRTLGDPRLASETREKYGDLEQYEPYADFANPYVDMLRAVYLMGMAESASDYDVARNLLRRVAGMAPQNPYVREDLDLADQLAQGEIDRPDLVYVFFETGFAPSRDQTQVSVPVFLVTDRVQIVPIAAPYLVFDETYVPVLHARTPGGGRDTALLASVDRIVAAEFRAQLPGLTTRMIAAAAFKVGVQYGLNEFARRNDPLLHLATMIGGAIWAASTNEADLRTWATLPKEVQYARVPTPSDGQISLVIGGRSYAVPVEPTGINVVVVRSLRPGVAPLITSTGLTPPEWGSWPQETQ